MKGEIEMTILQWMVQALSIFIVSFVLLRIMGKRAIAQMSSFDLIVVIVLGAMYGGALANQKTVTQTIITSLFIFGAYLAVSYSMLNNSFRNAIRAKPTVLISKGNINETGLRQSRITVPELLGHLRVKGYASLADVEFAIMEEAGDISVIPKSQKAPVTPSDLSIVTAPVSLPVPVIINGEWIDDNLAYLQKSREWALQKLAMHGFENKDVQYLTLVQVESDGNLTIDQNEPAIQGKFPPGQFMSADQASTAVMPSASNNPGISEVTKDALNAIKDKQKTKRNS